MTVTARLLVPSKIVEASQTTQYPANNVTTIIDKFTVTNFSSGAVWISVNLVTSGDTAGNQNLIYKQFMLQAGQTYGFPELVGQILSPGGFISTVAGTAASLNMRVSGREIT